jgi:membrane protein DedA with SNARE-associated domain
MTDWIINTVQTLGYLGIGLLMFLENVFPPIPSELIMPLAGFTTVQGELSFVGVVIAGLLGSTVGQLPLYYLGKLVSQERLERWADKYGKWLTLSHQDVENAQTWFDRHGNKVVFFGRLVPGIRSLVSIPAGSCGMSLPKFLAYSAAGMGLWAAVLAWIGRLLGRNYEAVSNYIGPVSYLVLGLIILVVIIKIVQRKRAGGNSD